MTKIEDQILAEIDRRNLKPRPLAYFLGKRAVFWTLAALSIVLGSVAAATSLFLLTDVLVHGGRELDEMPFDNLAAFAPFVWLALFGLFGVSAQASFRATRNGYKYRPMRVIVLTIALSAVLGSMLYWFDVGGSVHRYLATHVRSYAAYTTIPYAKWSKPAEGYLGGEVLAETAQNLHIRDFHGQEWDVDISAAKVLLEQSALNEGDIAIRGIVSGEHKFRAISVAPFD
jgi:hypothetical protein